MKNSIGILYLCTGEYSAFWNQFYQSCEKYFLIDYQKNYYVFTDKNEEIDMFDSPNIKTIYISALPWPLITLLRFHYFLMIENDLHKNDFLIFFNANSSFNSIITATDFLPKLEQGQHFSVVTHAGYFQDKPRFYPYERRKISSAYVSYSEGKVYAIGAVICGITPYFIEMCKVLQKNIESDLNKCIIAKWHDESHYNKFILYRDDIRILSPAYYYPDDYEIPFERRIVSIRKQIYFDVCKFKGHVQKKENGIILKLKKGIIYNIKTILYFRDKIGNR